MNIENAHAYTQAWFHASNAERKSWDEIIANLATYCPDIEESPIQLENKTDLAYIIKSPLGITLAISGTRDDKPWDPGWLRNFKVHSENGWHSGFKSSFYDLAKNPLDYALGKWSGNLWIYGHSAGVPIGLNAAYHARKDHPSRRSELIGLCAPQGVDSNGAAQCRKEHVCATMLQIGPHDPVDDVFKLVSRLFKRLDAQDYGYMVKLPHVPGLPGTLDNPIADAVVGGHGPKYVNKCLQKLFENWGQPDWKEQVEYLQAVIGVAIK
jgi:hypothetical protein